MRESMLMGSLDKLRGQKVKSLAEDAASCRSGLDRLQHLCSTIARLMDQERDSDIFLAKMAIPEMQLREMLERADEWIPEVQVSFGAKLEIEQSMQSVQSLDFSYPQEIRGAQGAVSRPTNVDAGSSFSGGSPPRPTAINKSKVIQNIDSLIKQKNENKARAVTAENFVEAAKIKKEVDALEEERARVSQLPDEQSKDSRIIKLKEEKAKAIADENFTEAERCKVGIAKLEKELAGGDTKPNSP